MSLKFATIPPKRLAQGITSASTSFYLNNIVSFNTDDSLDVDSTDLGTQHYCVFRNDTGTKIEIMEIDPATISSGPITIVRRGLSYYGDRTTEVTANKLDWSANETIVQLGTDAPQIFQWLKEYIDAASIAGAVDASTTAKGIMEIPTQAETDARTSTGGTGAKLAVTPDLLRATKYHDYIADAGANDSYAITVVPAITAYSAGQEFTFKANTVNTGAATLNVCGLGAKTIKKNYDMDLQNEDIKANQIVTVVYDGTNMQMKSPVAGDNNIISMVADEDITAGWPVGVSNYITGLKVARALRQATTATLSFTSAESQDLQIRHCAIGGDKFVFLNTQTSDDSLYATVGSINTSTKTVTIGTSVAVTADITASTYFCVCKLDTDKFIVFYAEDASTTIVKYRVGTVSGTTITLGSAATFATSATNLQGVMACEQISTDKGVMIYFSATPTDSRVIAFTTSGTTATAGTPVAIGTVMDDGNDIVIRKIGTDKFAMLTTQEIQIGTLSGTTITLGSNSAYGAATGVGMSSFEVKSPTTDVLVISYNKSSTMYAIACTISGTTPTFGSELNTTLAGNTGTGMYVVDTTTTLHSDTSADGSMVKITRSGTTLTLVGKVIKTVNTSAPTKLIAMDNGYMIGINVNSTTLSIYVQGMANNFFGIAQSSVSKGSTVNVKYKGIDANQSGLIPGAYYGITNGTFDTALSASTVTINSRDDTYLLALSATQILI